jgi:hypothetical protein
VTGRRRPSWPRARRTLRLVRGWDPVAALAVLVLAVGVTQLFAGALTTGVTTDEPIHVERAASWIDDGWYVPASLLVDGRPDSETSFSAPFVYGPAYAAFAHVANVVVGNEALDDISRSAAAYDVRHLTVAVLALLAVAAAGVAVWRLTGSRSFGLWASAGLLAVPAWTGHAFFNLKDVPAATGYTLVTVGLLLALCDAERLGAARRGRLAVGALLGGGVFIGAGTRTALWVPFALSLATYVALRLGQRRLGGIERTGGIDGAVGLGTLAGIAASAAVYPKVAATPFDLLTESVSGAAEFPYRGFTLTAGQLLSEHPPWWYLPAWIGASYPLLLGALAVLGGVLGIRTLVQAPRRRESDAIWNRPELGLLLVLQQALLLPAASVLTGATLYNGMRQHLYVLPALAILAGYGAWRFWRWARSRQPARRWRRLAVVLLGAALLVPMIEQTLLFPYNYAYVNPVAGIGGVEDEWETDYWFAAGPEALSRVPAGADLLCSRFLVLPWDADGRPELEPCDGEEQLAPYADRQGTAVDERWRNDQLATWVIGRKRAANRPPDYCEEADDVTRWLRGERVTMAYVLRCDPAEAARDTVR